VACCCAHGNEHSAFTVREQCLNYAAVSLSRKFMLHGVSAVS